MASNLICGRCGTWLAHPTSPCPRCGTSSAPAWTSAPYSSGPGVLRRPARRVPGLAAMLAVIPGLGHLYAGEPLKGLFYMLGSGGLEFLGLDLDLTAVGALIGLPIGLTGLALWMHGIFDAYHAAKRTNAQNGY